MIQHQHECIVFKRVSLRDGVRSLGLSSSIYRHFTIIDGAFEGLGGAGILVVAWRCWD